MEPLSDDKVMWIVSFGPRFSAAEIGRRIGCSPQSVLNVRANKQSVARIARLRHETYCTNCSHFDSDKGCRFSFPDVDLHGPAFARDCALYSRNELLLTDSKAALAAA